MSLQKLKTIITIAASSFGLLFMIMSALPAYALTYNQAAGQGAGISYGTQIFYPYPTGALVDDGGTIYFISGSTKVPFTSWQAFVGLGYASKDIVEGDLTNYTPSQNYTISTANAVHPWGSWLIYKGTVYYSTQAGMIGVPSASVFASNGGDWTFIVKANQYDISVLNANPNLPALAANDSRIIQTAVSQTISGYFNNPTNTSSNSLQISPSVLSFNAAAGGVSPTAQSINVNPGSPSASWTAQVQSSGVPGLSLSSGGSTGATVSGTGTSNISVNAGGPFTAGNFSSNIVVTSGGQSQTVTVSLAVNANTSTATSTPALTLSLNSALPSSLSVNAGAASQKVASFQIGANSLSSANINNITLSVTQSSIENNFQNLKLMVNGNQVGATQAAISSNGIYNFAPSGSLVAPAGGSIIIDVYADVAGGVTNENSGLSGKNLVSLNAVTGSWAINNTAIGTISPLAGQGLTVAANPTTHTLSANLNSALASPVALISGQTDQKVTSFQISANSFSAANINSITLGLAGNNTGNNFQNLMLMANGAQVGTTVAALVSSGSYTFNVTSPLVVPAGGSIIIDVYADVAGGVTNENSGLSGKNLVTLNSITGSWAVDNSAISAITPLPGQLISFPN